MDEARRFIRYVFPGIAAAGLLLFYFTFADPTRTFGWLKNANLSVAELLGLVVAAGAVGYLLSVFHHVLYGSIYSLFGFVPDFRPTLANAVRHGSLVLRVHQDGRALTERETRALSPRGAWLVLNCIWFDLLDCELQPAEERSRSLFDTMHASGTLFVGALIAFVFWFAIESTKTTMIDTLKSHWLVCLVSLLLALIVFCNYWWTTHLAEGFVSGMTVTLLARRETPLVVAVPRLPKWGRRKCL